MKPPTLAPPPPFDAVRRSVSDLDPNDPSTLLPTSMLCVGLCLAPTLVTPPPPLALSLPCNIPPPFPLLHP